MAKEKHQLDWSFMHTLHQTYFFIEKRMTDRLIKVSGITFAQLLILTKLHSNTTSSQHAIAVELELAEATVSRHVNALAQAKYLTRKEDPANRRTHIIAMTPKGLKALARAHTIIEQELKNIFAVTSKKDCLIIATAFERVLNTSTHAS